jgi:PLP dependent protein
MDIKENLSALKKKFVNQNCLLVAVSKTKPVQDIQEAYDAGIRDFGENKVQEMVEKHASLPTDIRWHMIGHLQRNKVKYIAPFIHLIHSVDSYKLLKEINKEAKKAERTIPCLLQMHIAQEENKFGFNSEEVEDLISSPDIHQLNHIKIVGLMGMATYSDNPEIIKEEFRNLKKFMDELKQRNLPANFDLRELSIGMSGDFIIAQEEGSTMVRIGSAIFGERN